MIQNRDWELVTSCELVELPPFETAARLDLGKSCCFAEIFGPGEPVWN